MQVLPDAPQELLDAAALAADGVFHLAEVAAAAGRTEAAALRAVFDLTGPDALDLTDDGWVVVHSKGTAAARALLFVAGHCDDVPLSDLALSIDKSVSRPAPVAPSSEAVASLVRFLGGTVEAGSADLSNLDWREPEVLDFEVYRAMASMPGQRATPSSLVAQIGMSRRRTKFTDVVLPGLPIVLRDPASGKGVLRLVGSPANYRRPPSVGRFRSLSTSPCGSRAVVSMTVSAESVESNSFNFPEAVRSVLGGSYSNARCGKRMSVGTEGNRKVSGVGPLVRALLPGYVDGQTLLIMLDRVAETVDMSVVGAFQQRDEDDATAAFLAGALPLAA